MNEGRNRVTRIQERKRVVRIQKDRIKVVTIGIAPPSSSSGGNDLNYVHEQLTPSDTWEIKHNLQKYPSISIYSLSGDKVEGNISMDNINGFTIKFSSQKMGRVFCN